jgi:hypothetical protein
MTHSTVNPQVPIQEYWRIKKREQRRRDREAKQKQDVPVQNLSKGENA